MMNYKAIIFDMDGTIINTETIWQTATQELLRKRDIVLPEDVAEDLAKKIHGLALAGSCSIIKDTCKLVETVEDLIYEQVTFADSIYKKGITLIDGFAEFHKKAQSYNLKMAVATNAAPSTVDVTNEVLNLEQFFGEHIYSIEKVNYVCKPNPAIYLHAADQLNTLPKNCIAIEDSAHGVRAAKAAGMYCIGINTWGKRELLSEADEIIDSYGQINLARILTWKDS
jgi:HAD superfamily hydrolase (TIGR01509 family)